MPLMTRALRPLCILNHHTSRATPPVLIPPHFPSISASARGLTESCRPFSIAPVSRQVSVLRRVSPAFACLGWKTLINYSGTNLAIGFLFHYTRSATYLSGSFIRHRRSLGEFSTSASSSRGNIRRCLVPDVVKTMFEMDQPLLAGMSNLAFSAEDSVESGPRLHIYPFAVPFSRNLRVQYRDQCSERCRRPNEDDVENSRGNSRMRCNLHSF